MSTKCSLPKYIYIDSGASVVISVTKVASLNIVSINIGELL